MGLQEDLIRDQSLLYDVRSLLHASDKFRICTHQASLYLSYHKGHYWSARAKDQLTNQPTFCWCQKPLSLAENCWDWCTWCRPGLKKKKTNWLVDELAKPCKKASLALVLTDWPTFSQPWQHLRLADNSWWLMIKVSSLNEDLADADCHNHSASAVQWWYVCGSRLEPLTLELKWSCLVHCKRT